MEQPLGGMEKEESSVKEEGRIVGEGRRKNAE
jgi:hypothetical protein